MCLLAVEDGIRLLWPSPEGELTSVPPTEGEEGAKLPTAVPKVVKKRCAAVEPAAGGATKKPRQPQTCRKCGQLKKGHVCTNP